MLLTRHLRPLVFERVFYYYGCLNVGVRGQLCIRCRCFGVDCGCTISGRSVSAQQQTKRVGNIPQNLTWYTSDLCMSGYALGILTLHQVLLRKTMDVLSTVFHPAVTFFELLPADASL